MQQIQFKSPTDTPIHVASLYGHAARVGPEFRDLPPILHKEAIAAGCITSNMVPESMNATIEGDGGLISQQDQIRNAIVGMLGGSDADDFTASGLPNLKKLSSRVGFAVDRDEMLAIWTELNKAAA